MHEETVIAPSATHPAAAEPAPAPEPWTVVPVGELAPAYKPGHGGYAHLRFPSVPQTAPGYLDFGPLMLAALERIPGDVPGYAMHPHDNAELITLVFEGGLLHRDSLGGSALLEPDVVQTMSAGRGLSHAALIEGGRGALGMEVALSPRTRDGEPRVTRARFPRDQRRGRWVTYASGRADRPAAALPIDQDAAICGARLRAGERLDYGLAAGRRGYLLGVHAPVQVGTTQVQPQERVLVEGPVTLPITATGETELVLLDLP
ncbi:MAG: pirin family protein [Myxococcales bacterium]|jgi:redox-sensitive bicupin YhaK (pirin superfamily)